MSAARARPERATAVSGAHGGLRGSAGGRGSAGTSFAGTQDSFGAHDDRDVDVLIVSLGATAGLRAADAELADSLRRAGARVALAAAARPRPLRTLVLTDLAWALAARRAAAVALAEHRPRAVIYSSTTAALLWPRPGAIRFDAPSAGNRPGRHGLWQRPLERRRLARAPLLLPWSAGGLDEAPASARTGGRTLVLPVPVEPSAPPAAPPGSVAPARDIAAIAYTANPLKKGLDRVLAAWARVRRSDEQLYIAGASLPEIAQAGIVLPSAGVTLTGPLAPADYRALLRRARVFVCAPRREDYGLAQLEALADGCQLVTTPAPGPYAALPIARTLDPRLVSDDLSAALRAALEAPAPDYTARARAALADFSPAAIDCTAREQLLPRLLGREDANGSPS
jgi:Glycosyl transferases group 1